MGRAAFGREFHDARATSASEVAAAILSDCATDSDSAGALRSYCFTRKPERASDAAIPRPMLPAPITPTLIARSSVSDMTTGRGVAGASAREPPKRPRADPLFNE